MRLTFTYTSNEDYLRNWKSLELLFWGLLRRFHSPPFSLCIQKGKLCRPISQCSYQRLAGTQERFSGCIMGFCTPTIRIKYLLQRFASASKLSLSSGGSGRVSLHLSIAHSGPSWLPLTVCRSVGKCSAPPTAFYFFIYLFYSLTHFYINSSLHVLHLRLLNYPLIILTDVRPCCLLA